MSICVYFHTCNVWMDCIPLLVPDFPFYTMPPMRCMCNLVTNFRRIFTILSFNIFGNLFTVKNELTWAMICFQSDMRTRTDTRTHTFIWLPSIESAKCLLSRTKMVDVDDGYGVSTMMMMLIFLEFSSIRYALFHVMMMFFVFSSFFCFLELL